MARVFFAGAENMEALGQLLKHGASNVLFSYYYLRRRGQLDVLLNLLKAHPQVKVFLDSGAFSFQTGASGNDDPTPYFEDYCRFLQKYGHHFEFAAELDVDELVEQELLDEWRTRLHDIGTTTIVPVWHEERGEAVWETYLHDPRWTHLGVGSDSVDTSMRLVNRAHLFGKTVHGFAQTKVMTTLRYIKFDTVDSTTWQVGDRFGDTCIFWQNKWVRLNAQHNGKELRRLYKSYFVGIGCNFQKILDDDRTEIRKANIIAWENLSKRLQLVHKSHVGLSVQIQDRDGSVAYARSTGALRGAAIMAKKLPPTSDPNVARFKLPRTQPWSRIAVATPVSKTGEYGVNRPSGDGFELEIDGSSDADGTSEAGNTGTSLPLHPRAVSDEHPIVEPERGDPPTGATAGPGVGPPGKWAWATRKAPESSHMCELGPETHKGESLAGSKGRIVPMERMVPAVPLPLVTQESLTLERQESQAAQILPRAQSGIMPKGIPVLHCSVCMVGPECPEYQEATVCAFDAQFRAMGTRNLDDLVTTMAGILEENILRLRRARLVEDIVMGGQVDRAVTSLSETCMGQAQAVAGLLQSVKSTKVTAQGEGLLSRVFGKLVADAERTSVVIDAEPVQVLSDPAPPVAPLTPVADPAAVPSER